MTAPDPRGYPFARVSGSHLVSAGGVRPLPSGFAAGDDAVALLAYGANADPERLRAKLAGMTGDLAIAVVAARLRGFDAVFSAHVSTYGAVAATLRAVPGTAVAAHVLLVPPAALPVLDATEPNYDRVTLTGVDVALEGGGRLERVPAYVSKHGCLAVDGEPRALAAIAADGRRLPAWTQDDAQAEARRRVGREDEPLAAFAARNASDAAARATCTAALHAGALSSVPSPR